MELRIASFDEGFIFGVYKLQLSYLGKFGIITALCFRATGNTWKACMIAYIHIKSWDEIIYAWSNVDYLNHDWG